MLSSLSSSRIRAVVSLAGVALSIVGFFLPMFTESNPGVPGSAHAIYEWQVVMRLASSSVLAGSFAALSLLGVLIVLATSAATLFAVYGPRLVLLKDLAAKWGLAIQLVNWICSHRRCVGLRRFAHWFHGDLWKRSALPNDLHSPDMRIACHRLNDPGSSVDFL